MESIHKLLSIMARLRDPENGCPWDLAQTYETIVPHTLEEAYEVAECIEKGDLHALTGELGDLLFQVVFYSQLASEQGLFTFDDVVQSINEKMVRRHPHVFAPKSEKQPSWDEIKRAEKGNSNAYLLDSVTATLPALSYANKMQKCVAKVGFDWPDVTGALDKVHEEFLEVKEALAEDPQSAHSGEEIGDLLFALVNVARHGQHDPEQLLRQASNKFKRRFNQVEAKIKQHKPLNTASLEEMDAAWSEVKQQEKS
jgi:ATP diphosphatase